MHPQRPGMKSRIHQEPRHGVRSYRLAVDGRDQHAVVAALAHSFLPARAQKMRQARGRLRALRLLGRQKHQQIGIAALAATPPAARCAESPQHKPRASARAARIQNLPPPPAAPASATPIHKDLPDRSPPTARTPASLPAVRAQLAQQVNGGRQRKLRGAQSADKVAAANPPALFERLQHVVDRAESAGHIFRRHRFAQQHAVAVEAFAAPAHGCASVAVGAISCFARGTALAVPIGRA